MRKKARNFTLLVLASLVAAAATLYFQRVPLVTHLLRFQFRSLTGTDAALENVRISKAKDSSDWIIEIHKVLLKNPDRFEIPNMAQLADVRMVLDPWRSLVDSQWKIRSLSVSMRRINFQTNGRGIFNLMTTPAIRSMYAERPPVPRRDFLAEYVELKLGKLYLLDYSKSPPTFELKTLKGKSLVYRNVDHPFVLFQAPALALLESINARDKELIAKLKDRIGKYQDSLKAPA